MARIFPVLRLWPILLVLSVVTPVVSQEVVPEQSDERLEFTRFFRPGLKTIEIEASWTEQHQVPTCARSDFDGEGLHVRSMRFRSDRSAVGLEGGWNSLTGDARSVDMWSAVMIYRRYFRVEPRRAWYWQAGGGGAYLSQLTREQSSNWNFYWEAAAGVQWPAGSRGAWLAQYRFIHISNGSSSQRNLGINASEFGFGRSIFF
ncbi:MAG: acyloxyacyl hydrolase [Armatimonadota bacterium]